MQKPSSAFSKPSPPPDTNRASKSPSRSTPRPAGSTPPPKKIRLQEIRQNRAHLSRDGQVLGSLGGQISHRLHRRRPLRRRLGRLENHHPRPGQKNPARSL